MILTTEKKGIRPVITVNKNLVSDENDKLKISPKDSYHYNYLNKEFQGEDGKNYLYKQMQGFTIANDKLFFYSSRKANRNYGILFGYEGDKFATKIGEGYHYGAMGHGNDMTYDSKNARVLLVGPNEYKQMWAFDPTKFAEFNPEIYTVKYNESNLSISSIAYNNVDNVYYGKNGVNMLSLNSSKGNDYLKVLNSFPASSIQTGEGIEFYKGYLYVVTHEGGLFDSSGEACKKEDYTNNQKCDCYIDQQLYCSNKYEDKDSAIINIYNAKQNSNSELSSNYGRIVGRLYLSGGDNSIGELETVSFKDDTMYLAIFYSNGNNNDVYHIWTLPVKDFASKIGIGVNYSIDYKDGKAIISSDEALKQSDGWTLSADKKNLTKILNENDNVGKKEEVKICDRYSNCKTETLKEFKLDNINFSNTETTYTGSPVSINTAVSDSKTSISYTYYSDNKCTKQIDAPIDVGTYYVKATSKGDSNYLSNSKCSSLKINKGSPKISLEAKSYNYTGSSIGSNSASAKAPNGKTEVSLNYVYNYYTDNECNNLTTASNGITSAGGAPINAGTYYVRATSIENNNLLSASSKCVSHIINKVPPNFSITSYIGIKVNSSTSISYNYNGNGSLKCTSSNQEVVTCNIDSGKLNIFGKKLGNEVITISVSEDLNYLARNDIKVNVNVLDEGVSVSTQPKITITPDGNSSYVKNQAINVLIEGTGSPIKAQQDIYFAFTTSDTEKPNYIDKIRTQNDTSQDSVTINIPAEYSSNLTGTYYLWIKDGISDENNGLSYEKVSKAFKFNNTIPDIKAVIVKSKKQTKGSIKTASLSNISKYEYSLDGINFINIDKNVFYTTLDNLKYYIRVTDEIGNANTIEAMSVYESTPLIKAYVLDRDGNQVTNDIISNERDLEYNIHFSVPSIENIVNKYELFSVKNIIDSKIEFSKNNIKILNKSLDNVTDRFNVDYNKNELIVIPKDVSNPSFYNEEYTMKIQARIKDDCLSTNDINGVIVNKAIINYDDAEVSSDVTSKLIFEEYTNIPNTKLSFNKVFWFVGFICIVGGIIIYYKIRELKQ